VLAKRERIIGNNMQNSAKPDETGRTAGHKSLQRYQQMRRLVLAFIILIAGAGLLFVSSSWGDSHVHEMIELSGVAMMAVGILGRMWSTLYIGGKKAATIVTDGPYSVVRNPLYFFSAIAAAGAGAQTGTLTFSLLFGIATIVAFHVVIFREEAYLSEFFGKAYQDYCNRVPRFFPRPSLYREPEVIEVATARIYRTFFDGLVFFIALPVMEMIESAQEAGMLPVLAHLY
jgi:protein-S-isoprenylcysteine O-methyltransferase Ste14